MIRRYTLVLGGSGRMGFPTPPLSLNRELHWSKKTEIKRELRHLVVTACRIQKIPKGASYVTAQLIYQPPTKNHPDPDNLTPTTKTVVDALQPTVPAYIDKSKKGHQAVLGYGLIPNDTAKEVHRPEARIIESTGKKGSWWGIELTIEYPDEETRR